MQHPLRKLTLVYPHLIVMTFKILCQGHPQTLPLSCLLNMPFNPYCEPRDSTCQCLCIQCWSRSRKSLRPCRPLTDGLHSGHPLLPISILSESWIRSRASRTLTSTPNMGCYVTVTVLVLMWGMPSSFLKTELKGHGVLPHSPSIRYSKAAVVWGVSPTGVGIVGAILDLAFFIPLSSCSKPSSSLSPHPYLSLINQMVKVGC